MSTAGFRVSPDSALDSADLGQVNRGEARKDRESLHEAVDRQSRFSRFPTEAVDIPGSRRDDPELDEDLGGEARGPARGQTPANSLRDEHVPRVPLLGRPEDDVRVEEDRSHL